MYSNWHCLRTRLYAAVARLYPSICTHSAPQCCTVHTRSRTRLPHQQTPCNHCHAPHQWISIKVSEVSASHLGPLGLANSRPQMSQMPSMYIFPLCSKCPMWRASVSETASAIRMSCRMTNTDEMRDVRTEGGDRDRQSALAVHALLCYSVGTAAVQ